MTANKNLPPIDPNVAMPAGVKASIARAEQLQEDFKKSLEPPLDPAAAPVVTPEGNPPAPAPEPAPTPEPAPAPAEQSWEHRYNSMKGRFDRAQAQLRQQGDRITNLEQLLAAAALKQPGPAPAPAPSERLVTEKEEEEYGAELLTIVGKRAQEVLTPEVIALRRELEQVKSQFGDITRNQGKTARQSMLSEMDRQLPNWKEINTHEDFLAWLALPDLYSGAIRHDLLSAAFEQNDTPRVLAFFNGFLTEEAALAPRVPEPTPTPPAITPPGKVSLEELAAPGRAKSAASDTPAAKPVFMRAQISQFFADVAAGKYRGREKEKDQIEAAIFAAQAEGRIR